MPATVATLATHVQARLEEIGNQGGEFWSVQYELYTAVTEALNDMMLLVGRPTQTIQIPFSLTPNTPWQSVPKGVFLISNVQGPQGDIHRVDLHSMDYVMSSWGPNWEADISDNGPSRWFPVNLTMFGVHPAPSVLQTVSITGIAYPVPAPWPWDGTAPIPFGSEFYAALEQYSAHICRIKESGAEFQESLSLYNAYLEMARRLSQIQDKRDPLIFSPVLGGTAGLRALTKR